jgi:hypothetical protein
VPQKSDKDAINYRHGVDGDKAKVDSVSNEVVLPDYVMLDFADEFVPSGEEAHARRTESRARPVPGG